MCVLARDAVCAGLRPSGAASMAAASSKGKKRKAGVIQYMGFEWTRAEADDFEVEAIVGKVVADGKATFANQASAPASNARACPLPAPHPSSLSGSPCLKPCLAVIFKSCGN